MGLGMDRTCPTRLGLARPARKHMSLIFNKSVGEENRSEGEIKLIY